MKDNIRIGSVFSSNRGGEEYHSVRTPLEAAINRFSSECSAKLAKLKSRIASDLAHRFNNLNGQLLWQAVNEADALAATTAFPSLVLPALAEEKVREASLWAARQRLIRERSIALAA
jgi:hypothetical protein